MTIQHHLTAILPSMGWKMNRRVSTWVVHTSCTWVWPEVRWPAKFQRVRWNRKAVVTCNYKATLYQVWAVLHLPIAEPLLGLSSAKRLFLRLVRDEPCKEAILDVVITLSRLEGTLEIDMVRLVLADSWYCISGWCDWVDVVPVVEDVLCLRIVQVAGTSGEVGGTGLGCKGGDGFPSSQYDWLCSYLSIVIVHVCLVAILFYSFNCLPKNSLDYNLSFLRLILICYIFQENGPSQM